MSHLESMSDNDVNITHEIIKKIKSAKLNRLHLIMTTTPQNHPTYANQHMYLKAKEFILNVSNSCDTQINVKTLDSHFIFSNKAKHQIMIAMSLPCIVVFCFKKIK